MAFTNILKIVIEIKKLLLIIIDNKIMNNNLSLEDVAKLYFPTKIDMIESAYNRLVNPHIGKLKIAKIKTEDIKNLSDTLKKNKFKTRNSIKPKNCKKSNWIFKNTF